MAKRKRTCDRWKGGVCAQIAEDLDEVTYCPKTRADNCPPGSCCHHPLARVRPLLAEMKQAGVRLHRYGAKLRDTVFVKKLYRSFLKARIKRSTKSSRGSSKS